MLKKIFGKPKKRKGTTLVETLATVVLLGLMGIAVVAGIGAVRDAYRKVVRKANEQVLLSTTLIEMRSMIRDSRQYSTTSGRFQSKEGYWFKFLREGAAGRDSKYDGKGVVVAYYVDEKAATGIAEQRLLVPESNGKISEVYSDFQDVKVESDKVYIYDLHVGETKLLKDEDGIKYCVTVIKTESGGGS